MSWGYSVPFCKYTAFVWEGEISGIKLILLLVMELQHGRTPQQASACQWHVFLLAVNTFCTTHTNRTKPAEGIFLDFLYIQYYFQVISIPLMSHWKVPCFHQAGVCHMHIVPFCTWMGVAGPLRNRPTQNSWTPRDTTTPFPTRQCTQKLVQDVSFLLIQGFKVRYTFRKWG